MSGIAERYSEALIGAARERGAVDAVEGDAQAILELIAGSEELSGFISNPFVQPEQKSAAFRQLFEGKVNAVTLNFLLLLSGRRRDRFVVDILRAFLVLLEEERGVITAEVRSAAALSDGQISALSEKLSRYSGKQVRLATEVDPSLKAGFIARIGDQVFDASLGSMLSRIHRQLKMEN